MEQLPSASLLEADWQWWASTETGKSPIKRTRGGGERWSSIEQSPASKVDLSLFDVITSSLWCRRMYARPTPRHFRYNAKAKSLYGALKRNSKKFTSAAAADFFLKDSLHANRSPFSVIHVNVKIVRLLSTALRAEPSEHVFERHWTRTLDHETDYRCPEFCTTGNAAPDSPLLKALQISPPVIKNGHSFEFRAFRRALLLYSVCPTQPHTSLLAIVAVSYILSSPNLSIPSITQHSLGIKSSTEYEVRTKMNQ